MKIETPDNIESPNSNGGQVNQASASLKIPKVENLEHVMPLRSYPPLNPPWPYLLPHHHAIGNFSTHHVNQVVTQPCKQFWKAGDYDIHTTQANGSSSGGMDHLRVHPRFLHSNATSHKWALGAFAELLDNSLDEVCHGATYVHIDVLTNKKDGSKMLLVEDNGGGLCPDKMRQCMSLGYSAKSKVANAIGQYGNGFKTSTMRLGADVIVFSCSLGSSGNSWPTQSIGLLSYTFLRSTGKEDIVVPIIDYEKRNGEWRKLLRTSERIWNKNLSTIVNWSPYSTEQELLQQINCVLDHGTKVIIYNLWEDEEGQLELDFDTDPLDIQIRGINRDERMITMVQQFPNSKYFLTYQHSLRSYASILYLRLPTQFRIYLRGLEVKHHNMINDMMLIKEMTYKPQIQIQNSMLRQAVSNVTIGFVKDAHHHIDVQGFNVYHKNRLIKPFWRVWNPAGSDGRGVIGVLEANFVEPSHDKQGFERTTVLSRLESRLLFMQKNYWGSNCGRVGYAARRVVDDQEHIPTNHNGLVLRSSPAVNANLIPRSGERSNGASNSLMEAQQERPQASVTDEKAQPQDTPAEGAEYAASKEKPHDTESKENTLGQETASKENVLDQETASEKRPHETASKERAQETASEERAHKMTRISSQVASTSEGYQIKMEEVKGSTMERSAARNAVYMKLELKYVSTCQNERCKSLKLELEETKEKMMDLDKEQFKLIGILLEERTKGEMEEDRLKNSLMEANKTISALTEKVAELERVIHAEAKLKKSEDSVTMLPS